MRAASIPYIDNILTGLQQSNPTLEAAFGTHIHWGYWDDSTRASGTLADFVQAAARMSERIVEVADVKDGQSVVDVGCGFGGTVAALDAHLSGAKLVGLNIDPRQLERARTLVKARGNNRIEFIEGDACKMPLESDSADVMTSVECVFHFPSRELFFAEAARVIAPGGRLIVSDFVPVHALANLCEQWFDMNARATHGCVNVGCSLQRYSELGAKYGLTLRDALDITPHTTPTYAALRPVARPEAEPVMRALELGARTECLRYMVLRFEQRRIQ